MKSSDEKPLSPCSEICQNEVVIVISLKWPYQVKFKINQIKLQQMKTNQAKKKKSNWTWTDDKVQNQKA